MYFNIIDWTTIWRDSHFKSINLLEFLGRMGWAL